MVRALSLTTKTALLLAALTLTVLLTVTLSLLRDQEKSLKSSILEGLDGRAVATAHGIDLFLEEGLRDSSAVAASIPQEAILQGKLGEVESHLRQMQEIFPNFRSGIFILDKQGKLLADYPSHPELRGQSFAFREYFQRTMREQRGVVSQPYRSARIRTPVLTFTAPIRDTQGRIVAIVGSSTDLLAPEVLGAYIQQQFGKTGYLYVFDRHRQLLMHPDRDRILTAVEIGKNSLMEAALNGFEGGAETVNSKGVPMLMSVRRIPNTDWMVAVQLPQKEAYAPIVEARTRIFYSSSLALLLVTAIGVAAIRRVSRPLRQLEQVAMRITSDLEKDGALSISPIADCALNQLTDIRSRDEVGRLASSFLKLGTRLESTFRALNSTNQQLLEAKERVETEAKNRQFQHSLVDAIHEVSLDGILVVNKDEIVVSCNQRFFDVWQLSDPRISGDLPITVPDKPLLSANLARVKDPNTFLKRVQELYADPAATDHCEVELKDGRTLERYSTGLRSENDQYLGRVWFFRDISERKQAEQALRSSEEKFRQLAENIHEVFWMMSPATKEIFYVSPAYERIWGRSCDSLYKAPMSWIDAIHPDDLEQARSLVARQMQGEPVETEYRIRTAGGEEKWIRDRSFPVRDQSGKLIRVVGIAEEITERKRHEAELAMTNFALAASEARYRKPIDLSPDAVIVGRKHVIALANKAAVELFGVSSAGDLVGRRFADLVSPEARSGIEELVQRMYEREMQLPLQEVRALLSDGSLIDVEFAAASFGENGERAVQVVFRNITQRKQAEAEQARLIRGIEQVAESVVITDLEGSILYVNPAFEKITGYAQAEAIGSNPRILKSDCHPASLYQAMWETLRSGETWSGKLINKRKNGLLFTEEATISPIRNQDGTIINFVAVKRDVTQETLLRDQLNQAQKMEAVGRLAGGIAHDFNNLLMVIQAYTEMLQDRLPIQDSLRRNTEQVLKAAERGASLTGQMLAFSRKQIISPVVLDLNAVIDETTKMLKRVIREDINFQVDLGEGSGRLRLTRIRSHRS